MAFRLPEGESVAVGVRLIAREQIDYAIEELSDRSLARDLVVHEVRKRCKKLRGLLRLVRPCLGDSYARENAHFRDAARLLSPLRDDQSIIDAYDALMAHFADEIERRSFTTIRRRLARRRKERAALVSDVEERIAQVRGQMEAGRERVANWSIDAVGVEAWRGGFEQTYRRARKAMALAYEAQTTEHFHEWRKRVKYHWYHTRILQPLWPDALGVRGDAANTLGEMLGMHHDLVVLGATLLDKREGFGDGRAVQALAGLIDRRRSELAASAKPLGARLFADKVAWIGQRWVRYWDASQEEREARQGRESQPAAISA
jgi:CHAD domain-containing protein